MWAWSSPQSLGLTQGITAALMHILLRKSGYTLAPLDTAATLDQEVESMVLSIVMRKISFEDLVNWFQQRTRKVSCS